MGPGPCLGRNSRPEPDTFSSTGMGDTSKQLATPFQFDLRRAPGATALFVLGVALTFAPLMLMTVTPVRPLPAATVAVWFAISGVCAVLWALAGTLSRKLFLVAAPAQALAAMAIAGQWLGPLSIRASGVNWFGLIAVLCIAGGYACFVTYIIVHGRRAIALSFEMTLAARIHRSLVPEIALSSGPFEIAGRSVASGVMGGDVMDARTLADGSIQALVADVSGHGVRAGIVMAMVKAAIESFESRGSEETGGARITALAGELNRVLVRLTEPDMFVTAAIVHVGRGGEYHALLAGHPPILHRSGERSGIPCAPAPVGADGLPLGIIDELDAIVVTGQLRAGESIVLYSDGLTEARVGVPRPLRRGSANAAGAARSSAEPNRHGTSLLGVEGFASLIATLPVDAGGVAARAIDDVARLSVASMPEDDQTVLVIRNRG